MKTIYALLFAAAGAPLSASAQADQPAPLPYHSAYAGYQPMPEPPQPPDQRWRQANRQVAGSGHAMEHMGHMGNMDHHAPAGHMHHGAMDHGNMRHGALAPAAAGERTVDHSRHGGQPQGDGAKGPGAGQRPDATPSQPVPHQHGEH